MTYQITQREYNEEIARLAEAVYSEIRDDTGEISELAFQAVDGHQWIIYTAYHQEVLSCTSNPDAWEDIYTNEDLGRIVAEDGLDAATQAQAFFSFEQDLNKALYELVEG